MAQSRKLNSEIERTLKRVQEGLHEFEEIWQKVYSAQTPALKEKHEADLKKEIKKLQRFRDQIKTWLGSSDIRDKDELLAARRQIERDMERYDVLCCHHRHHCRDEAMQYPSFLLSFF